MKGSPYLVILYWFSHQSELSINMSLSIERLVSVMISDDSVYLLRGWISFIERSNSMRTHWRGRSLSLSDWVQDRSLRDPYLDLHSITQSTMSLFLRDIWLSPSLIGSIEWSIQWLTYLISYSLRQSDPSIESISERIQSPLLIS